MAGQSWSANDARAMATLVASRVGYPAGDYSASVEWEALGEPFIRELVRHGVVVLAHESPLADRLNPPVQSKVQELARHQTLECLSRASRQQQVLSALERWNIPAMQLKGLAFSAIAYGAWFSRGTAADIDVLVPPLRLHDAEEALAELDFVPRMGTALPARGSRLSDYLLWLHYERGYTSATLGNVDLHWRTMPGSATWASFAGSWDLRREVRLPSGSVWTLGPAETIAVAASQGESESWTRLKRLADLWMAWSGATAAQRRAAMSHSLLVPRSMACLPDRWQHLASAPTRRVPTSKRWANLWRIRRGSGPVTDAAMKAMLGQYLPARSLDSRRRL